MLNLTNCRTIYEILKESSPNKNANPVLQYFKEIIGTFSIKDIIIRDSYCFEATPGHSLVIGNKISIVENFNSYSGTILEINNNTITMDTPFPVSFTANLKGNIINTNLAVDASNNRRIFYVDTIKNQDIAITKAIIHILGSGNKGMDDSKFGNINKLTKGIIFRKKVGKSIYKNYGNIKSNKDLLLISYYGRYSEKAPTGYYGFTAMINFYGIENAGVVIRLSNTSYNQQLELIIQDDLSQLAEFSILVEGHEVK